MHGSKGSFPCLVPSDSSLPVPGTENQSAKDLDLPISDEFLTPLLHPLLSDPVSPTFMASADQNAPYSSPPDPDYRDVNVDISHIQSVSSPGVRHPQGQHQQLQDETIRLASNVSVVDHSATAQGHIAPPDATQDEQESNRSRQTNSSSSRNGTGEDVPATIPAQPAIQKSQKRLKRGPYMCKLCKGFGHTAKTCTKRRNPMMQNALNPDTHRDQYLLTLTEIEEVSRKTPKEQLHLHYEAILAAIYQLSLSAFRRNPYRRESALQALYKCLEAEKIVSKCIICYTQASARLSTVLSGKENMANYSGPIKKHPEFFATVLETRRCLYRTMMAMKNADCSIRNILSSSGSYCITKRQVHMTGLTPHEMALRQHVRQRPALERNAFDQTHLGSPSANQRRSLSFICQPADKSDVLNLGEKTGNEFRDLEDSCIPSSSIDYRSTSHQQIDHHFRDIDLFLQEEKE
ncbi:unnamed protein product [Agarophyton chilense]